MDLFQTNVRKEEKIIKECIKIVSATFIIHLDILTKPYRYATNIIEQK